MSKYGADALSCRDEESGYLESTTMTQSTLFTAVRVELENSDEFNPRLSAFRKEHSCKRCQVLQAILLHLGLHPSAARYSGEPRQAPRIVWEAFLSVLEERHLFFNFFLMLLRPYFLKYSKITYIKVGSVAGFIRSYPLG